MDRADSGFGESCLLKATVTERISGHMSNTAPIRQPTPKNTIQDAISKPRSIDTENQRPASGKRSSGQRRPIEPRRKSIGSSSENSTTRSRGHGYGSNPSSRRTSCTLVDPSRPARHYRIKSSQTVPTANREIDDVLALHFRSCSLFQNPSYHSPLPSPSISGYGVDTDHGSVQANAVALPAPQPSTGHVNTTATLASPKQSEDTVASMELANTTMHWTSPGTRRREYDKIDRANSGMRGFMRKIVPRCVSGPPPPRFYEKDMSDVGSVRRYRICDDQNVDEKNTSSLRRQDGKLDEPTLTTATTKTRQWGCF